MATLLSPCLAHLNTGSEKTVQRPVLPFVSALQDQKEQAAQLAFIPATSKTVTTTQVPNVKPVSAQTGVASWYTDTNTASGERYRAGGMTAAHRSLKLGTYVRVTNLANNKSTVVRINDRGPYIKGRMLDLSVAAARELAMIHSGVTKVKMEVLSSAPPREERM